ncbi:MAG: hypothetical protein GY780_02800 [bacterium]|nr:hypothetical protein [bacterium]
MMLISKRSRRKSELFDSRFRNGEGSDFPLRQYMRCKEEFSGGLVHLVLLAAFFGTLLGFGDTLNNLFLKHGTDLNPGYRWIALGLLVIFLLSVLRRILHKVLDLKDVRKEMALLKTEMSRRDV